ncbi:unnamed protein product [Symbiodinium sp. CCMP2592]|nr:unnamed protein product [Symbiodinium sp. CCMP2592]
MALRAGLRRLAVIKDSFPQMRTPGCDPSKPSVSKVMKEMLNNQTAALPHAVGEEAAVPGTPSKHIVTDSDGKSMPMHLPKSYLPRASAGTSGPSAGAAFRGLSGSRSHMSAGALPIGGQKWRPPGWKEGPSTPEPKPQDKGPNAEFYERPTFEVWGVRVVAALVLYALYIEFKDVSISPSGQITRKPRPKRHLTPQEEEEQRRLQEASQK